VSVYWYVVIGCVATGMAGWLWSVSFLRPAREAPLKELVESDATGLDK